MAGSNESWTSRDVSVIEVRLTDLDHNIRVLRGMLGPACGLCPIVKADAYGLGAARIAKRLAHNGAGLLAVYTPEQAAELFRAAIGARVLVLMPLREVARVDELYRGMIADRLQLTVHDMDHVGDLIAITERYGVTISVHLEIDTGMSRGGCSLDDAPAVLKRMTSCRRLRLVGLFTHFANSDSDVEFTDEQLTAFDKFLADHKAMIPPDCHIHVASSFATLRSARYHKTMVRVGLAWAGYGAEWINGPTLPAAQQLRPIVSWKSRLVNVKNIPAGTPVGYGSSWTSKRASVVGLIPVGYADGYPIGLGTRNKKGKGASVGILASGEGAPPIGFANVVGAVNMDQITVDLTEIVVQARKTGRSVGVGTMVELVSADSQAPNHLSTLAAMAGTIPHEMLCRLNPRVKRVYTTSAALLEPAVAGRALAG